MNLLLRGPLLTLAAEVLADMGMWAPTTFSHIHVGDSATHCHHTGVESRIDYVLLGGRAVVTEARSCVNHEIDNGSPNLDHWAVEIQLKGKLRGLRKRRGLLRPKFDTEKLDTKEGKAIVRKHAAVSASPPGRSIRTSTASFSRTTC